MSTAAASMNRFGAAVRRFAREEGGAVAVEYGVLLVMILVAIVGIGSLSNVANKQGATFNEISDVLD
jgi:Flp pilus assembly pilin Flp